MNIGDKAPDLTLFNTEKQKVSLHDYHGRNLIVLFFPLAFTSVCTDELCNMRDNMTMYNSYDADVVGISVDSLYALAQYKAQQNLNFPLLSDFNKDASKAFDVLYSTFPLFEMQGVSKRASFVIDKKGIIRYAEVCAKPEDLPDFIALETVLKTL